MSEFKHPVLYRVISQTDQITIAAETAEEVTSEQAAEIARQDVLTSAGHYRNFVLQPICTKFEWVNGQINFCPRCGKNINEQMDGGPGNDMVTDIQRFDCEHCEADITVEIHRVVEEDEDEGEEDEQTTE